MYRLYEVIATNENGELVKEIIPSTSNKTVRKECPNWDVLRVTDVTEQYPISLSKLTDTLIEQGWGETEIKVITKCVGLGYKEAV